MIAPATTGLFTDIDCPCRRLAMTRVEAYRRAGWWQRFGLPIHPYRCPLLTAQCTAHSARPHYHIAWAVR